MTYRELLEQYKKGKLDEQQKSKIEADIERQDAISDYLYEEGAIPEFMDTFEENNKEDVEEPIESMQQEKDFVRLVNKSIRKAFAKMGVIVCTITLVVVLFIQLVLPDAVSHFYYNPGEEIGENSNLISRDMAVYTELVIPIYVRDNVSVDAKGYGNYDISIYQNTSYNGSFTNLAGKIEKGKLTFYDMNLLNCPAANVFAWYQMYGDTSKSLTQLIAEGKDNFCLANDSQAATEALNNLNEKENYVAYVTLDRMMNYEEFMEFIANQDGLASTWCAVVTNGEDLDTNIDSMFRADNIGFQCTLTKSTSLTWDKDKYPNLLLWDEGSKDIENPTGLEEKMQTKAFMKTHFVSMLRYMSEQEKFLTMMGESTERFSEAANFVEKHGITIYGFAAITGKETLLELNEKSQIYEIYTQALE